MQSCSWIVVALSLALPRSAAATCDATAHSTLVGSFRAGLETIVAREGLPGAVAAFWMGDCPVTVASAGFADVERRVPMGPDARFLSGSIGKSFVAALVLDLVHDGRLSLDDKIEKWLGTAPWFERLPNAHDVTVRMLLNHGSGIPDYVFSPRFVWAAVRKRYFGDPFVPFSPEQVIDLVLDRAPLFPAGQGYKYSDTGYILLGLVIERATGRRYYDLLRERILGPLGLELTSPADRIDIPGLASGYHRRMSPLPSKVAESGVLRFHPGTEWTGGGLATNPRDLAVWARTLYEGRAFDWPYLALLDSSPNPLHSKVARAYGIGFFVFATRHGAAYGHSGWFPGYRGSMLYFPTAHLAMAFQTNTDRAGDPREYLLELAERAMPATAVAQGAAPDAAGRARLGK